MTNQEQAGEGDLIIDSKHKQAIVTLVDRSIRYTFMAKVGCKTAQAVQEVICRCLSSVKKLKLRRHHFLIMPIGLVES